MTPPFEIDSALLAKWFGGRAGLWSFEPTHSTARLHVRLPVRAEILELVCVGCIRISGPVHWQGSNLEVTTEYDPSEHASLRVLRDRKAGFEVRCLSLGGIERSINDLTAD